MKKHYLLLVILLFISNVNAITFQDDTTFNEGNINYIFKEGITVEKFDTHPGGIKINDDERLGITIEGGKLDVIFYEFDNTNKKISFNSSVPQTITFKITSDGVEQYLYDGKSYYLNSILLDTNEKILEYKTFETNKNINTNALYSTKIEKLSWWQQKIIEIEISQDIDENGIITSNLLTITILSLSLFIVILLVVVIIWVNLRK